jgi:hypothetical protein
MADSLTIFLFGSDTPIEVDLEGRSSRDEWKNLRNRKGRWSKAWVEVRAEHDGTRRIYIDPDAIAKVVVDFTTPISPEVADKEAHEQRETDLRQQLDHAPDVDA